MPKLKFAFKIWYACSAIADTLIAVSMTILVEFGIRAGFSSLVSQRASLAFSSRLETVLQGKSFAPHHNVDN